jgi:DNA repair photolyase
MTFDTYSVCGYGCLYCFSWYQKSHVLKGYREKEVRSVDPNKVRNLFDGARRMNPDLLRGTDSQFVPYIGSRITMQWGALADQFDTFEQQHGVSLELLRFFDAIDYPLSFSTKGVWWTKDPRYMELFARHAHNWHVKLSIICWDVEKARRIEAGVDSPQERVEAIRRLTRLGIRVTLRLRPYILGVSDDYRVLIRAAHDAGADSVTSEFLCIEARADAATKARYTAMSRVTGFDLWDFYMRNSPQHGYKRLSYELKHPIFLSMREEAHKLGMAFTSSDSGGRDLCDSANCCGVPAEWRSQTSHFGGAVLLAQRNGEVHWSEIEPEIRRLFGFPKNIAANFNTNTKERAQFLDASMADYMRVIWNSPKSGKSPAKAYGVLEPAGLDSSGDVIYRPR